VAGCPLTAVDIDDDDDDDDDDDVIFQELFEAAVSRAFPS
jgi:hypothetical protein